MDFTYENQGTITFLSYAVEDGEQLDSMSLGMITNNRIPGLAGASFSQTDTKRHIRYNVSAKVTVNQLLMGSVNKKRLLGVLNGVVSAFLSAEEYMIDPSMIVLDTKYMFSDVSTCETLLICLPILRTDRKESDIAGFIKKIMFSSRFDQTEDSDYVARIISYLNNATSFFSLERFQALLKEISFKNTMNSPLQPTAPKAVSNLTSHVPEYVPMPEGKRPVPEINVMSHQTIDPKQRAGGTLASGSNMGLGGARAYQATPQLHGQLERNKVAFSVPGKVPQEQQNRKPGSRTAGQAGGQEKDISLFYLLQHYNKENAEAYKAQKERKKAEKAIAKPPKVPKSGKGQKRTGAPAFDVPGQERIPSAPKGEESRPVPVTPVGSVAEPMNVFHVSPRPLNQLNYNNVNFGDTVYLDNGNDSDTVIMGMENSSQRVAPYLIRKANNEKIPLDKENFRIGRDSGFNDYAIVNNRYIGHSHCHVLTRDGEYFVVDDNSKNHTSVNGSIIPSGQEIKLAHGFILSVADEEFEFRIY